MTIEERLKYINLAIQGRAIGQIPEEQFQQMLTAFASQDGADQWLDPMLEPLKQQVIAAAQTDLAAAQARVDELGA